MDEEFAVEYVDESSKPNIFEDLKIKVNGTIKENSWESGQSCLFPYANKTIHLASIREGLWIPMVYLSHTDNHLHPFISPYGELRCLRVQTRHDPLTNRLAVSYGCRTNKSAPLQWNYRFEFLANKRIYYRERYGCHRTRQLRRTVIANTDYANYVLLHGCQSNAAFFIRANALMVLVRTLNVSRDVRWAIGNYTRTVLLPKTESKLTYLNLTQGALDDDVCDCSRARDFVFCDAKFRFRRDPDVVPVIKRGYYWGFMVASVVALLMTTIVLVEQLQTFRSVNDDTNYVLVD
uniref:Uncharacterized protein n=1 Tax=Anopheles maculatus TaxID=74869 RepID=A0A182SS12_9DIPT